LVSRFHFHCFHEAITLRKRVYASGTFGENMMPNARVRGLKTRNISQKYVNIDRLFSRLLPVAKKLAQPAPAAQHSSGREQLAARFEERLAQQPNFYQKFYKF
jgi:hypothetical protein